MASQFTPNQSQQQENSQPEQDGLNDNGFSSVYLSCYENDSDLQPDADEQDEAAHLPSYGHKRPRSFTPPPISDEPDLAEYFATFEHFTEADQVKYCRAYASMLAAKSSRNRLRMGHGYNPNK